MREKVTELLKVLDIAIEKVPPGMKTWQNNFEVHILEIELETEKPLCERLGVSKGIFPPVEELEDDELKVVMDKILDLWAMHNYYAEILEEYHPRKAYTLLLSVWEESVPLCTAGSYHFDFYMEEDYGWDSTYKKPDGSFH